MLQKKARLYLACSSGGEKCLFLAGARSVSPPRTPPKSRTRVGVPPRVETNYVDPPVVQSAHTTPLTPLP